MPLTHLLGHTPHSHTPTHAAYAAELDTNTCEHCHGLYIRRLFFPSPNTINSFRFKLKYTQRHSVPSFPLLSYWERPGRCCLWDQAAFESPAIYQSSRQGSTQSSQLLYLSSQAGQTSLSGSDLTAGAGSQVQRPVLFFLPDSAISKDHSTQAAGAGRVLLFSLSQRSSGSLLEFSFPAAVNGA